MMPRRSAKGTLRRFVPLTDLDAGMVNGGATDGSDGKGLKTTRCALGIRIRVTY